MRENLKIMCIIFIVNNHTQITNTTTNITQLMTTTMRSLRSLRTLHITYTHTNATRTNNRRHTHIINTSCSHDRWVVLTRRFYYYYNYIIRRALYSSYCSCSGCNNSNIMCRRQSGTRVNGDMAKL